MSVVSILSFLTVTVSSLLLFFCSSASAQTPVNLRWNGVKPLGQDTINGSVSAVAFNGLDHLLYRGANSNALTHMASADGQEWSTEQVPIGQVSSAPGVVVSMDGKRLHIFYVESETHLVRHVYQNDNGEYARPLQDDLQIRVDSAPSAAISGDDSSICVVGAAANTLVFSKRIYSSSGYDTVNSGWSGFTLSAPPSLVWFNNSFHAFYLDARGYEIVHIISADCISWSKAQVDKYTIGFQSFAGPAAFVLPGTATSDAELRLVFRDGYRTLQQCASFDGFQFQPAMEPIEYFQMTGTPSVAWSPAGYAVLAGGDVYQSGAGGVYTSVEYSRSNKP